MYYVNNIGILELLKSERKVLNVLKKFISHIEKTLEIKKKKAVRGTKGARGEKDASDIASIGDTELENVQIEDETILFNNIPINIKRRKDLGAFDLADTMTDKTSQSQIQKYVAQRIANSLYNGTNAIQLTDNNIAIQPNGAITLNGLVNKCGVLKAYASWCGYCQRSASIITELANKYNNPNSNISIYVIEMSNSPTNPLNKLVEGFPTYLYVDNNNIIYPMNDDFIRKQISENQIQQSQADEINNVMNTIASNS